MTASDAVDWRDEKQALHGYLRRSREALLWKLDGLSDYDVRRPMTPTGTNLLGLVKHTAATAAGYFADTFGRPWMRLLPDFADDAEPNADMFARAEESREQVIAFWHEAWGLADEMIDRLPLDAVGSVPWWPPQRRETTLHRVLVHMVEETARHAGHADIVRELIDGQAGRAAGADNLPDVDAAWWAAYRARLTDIARAIGPVTDASAPGRPRDPSHTTLARTLPTGAPGPLGYRPIVRGPGEPTRVRTELLTAPRPGGGRRRALLAFTQLSDMHVVDAQSPARVEFLDRFDDPGVPTASVAPFTAAYRPWEMLSAHVAESMVQAVNRLAGGPVTGRPLDFAISTGDNSDNTQYDEVRRHIDLLDGGADVRSDSGSHDTWEGVGGPNDLDRDYWHPDGTPLLGSPDRYTARHGYPQVPGLLDRCRTPFRATGLRTPWFSVFGNHDGLLAGNLPSDAVAAAIATGPVKVIGLPDGFDPLVFLARLRVGDLTVVSRLLADGPVRQVTADPARRPLSRAQHVAEHFVTTGTPLGHGYTARNRAEGTAYYAFERGGVRGIVLDTVNPHGLDNGSLDATQFAWLAEQLEAASARYLDPQGAWRDGRGTDQLVLIFSHHTIATMDNTLGAGRVDGAAVEALLLRHPNVVAWINGHTHRNAVTPRPRAAGTAAPGGFWEINTASHVDWPQQSRVVELVDNGEGTLSVFATILDHAASPERPAAPSTPLELASLSRELAANDPQRPPASGDTDGRRGTALDRNVELLLPAPFPLPAT